MYISTGGLSEFCCGSNWPWAFVLVRRIFINVLIFLFFGSPSGWPSFGSTLVVQMNLEVYPFLLDILTYGEQVVKLLPQSILGFSGVHFFFSFMVLFIWVLSFLLLTNWGKGSVSFVYLLKEPTLRFSTIYIAFFASFFINSPRLLFFSSSPLNLGLLCSYFSKFLSCNIKSFVRGPSYF